MRGLALSGGGAFGAWQAGHIYRLAVEGARYDIVAGVSVGSVNAAGLCMFGIGDEMSAAAHLRSLWLGLRTQDVYRRWFPLGRLSWWKHGMHDLAPLRRFLKRKVSTLALARSGRGLVVGAVSRGSREWTEWTGQSPDIIDAIVASCAIPLAFEPQAVDGVSYIDGGVRSVVPVESLLARGVTSLDVILCHPVDDPADEPGNPLDAGLDAVDTSTDQITRDDLARIPKGFDCRIYRPDSPLGDKLDFSAAENRRRWLLGAEHGAEGLE